MKVLTQTAPWFFCAQTLAGIKKAVITSPDCKLVSRCGCPSGEHHEAPRRKIALDRGLRVRNDTDIGGIEPLFFERAFAIPTFPFPYFIFCALHGCDCFFENSIKSFLAFLERFFLRAKF